MFFDNLKRASNPSAQPTPKGPPVPPRAKGFRPPPNWPELARVECRDDRAGVHPVGNRMTKFHGDCLTLDGLGRGAILPCPRCGKIRQADRARDQHPHIFRIGIIKLAQLSTNGGVQRSPQAERWGRWAERVQRLSDDLLDISFPSGDQSHPDGSIQGGDAERTTGNSQRKLIGSLVQMPGVAKQGQEMTSQGERCHRKVSVENQG